MQAQLEGMLKLGGDIYLGKAVFNYRFDFFVRRTGSAMQYQRNRHNGADLLCKVNRDFWFFAIIAVGGADRHRQSVNTGSRDKTGSVFRS